MGRPRGSASWNVNGVFEAGLRAGSEGAGIAFLFRLIARHAWFVDPQVARAVPTVFPRTARGRLGAYRSGEEQGGITYWENQPAKYAFFAALGATQRDFANFNVCHVWPGSAGDPRHFTRLSNVIVVPRTLWRFTDWEPVQAILQRRSFELSGYAGPRRRAPLRPAEYPENWREPLTPDEPGVVVKYLRHLRATSPTFKKLSGSPPPRSASRASESREQRWAPQESLPNFEALREGVKRSDARDLDGEAWKAWSAERGTLEAFQSWLVGNSYFANKNVAATVENPFPKCRRLRLAAGERHGRVIDGITLAPNIAAADSLLVAIQKPIRTSLGGNVDHPWPAAPQLPAHFCNLRGLVLVPAALGSLVDAAPMRAMLQRHLFERTGYSGPGGAEPRRPEGFPRAWPETVALTQKQEARAIRMLERYRKERPGYYRRVRRRGTQRP